MNVFDQLVGLLGYQRADHYLDACRKVARTPVHCRVGSRHELCTTLDEVHAFYQHTP